ncbi:MAG: hypothetical protein IT539_09680 [Bradyrhizobiaceae bacterium]|nr:hypothetical protein [Bradyrhizobiaceae bacterium]
MNGRRVLILVLALLGYAGALQAWAQQQGVDPFARGQCEQEFQSIQAEMQKRGTALQAAGKGKAPAPEVCRLLRSYTTSEARLIKFFEEKKATCGVPENVIKQATESHAKATAMRDQVCKVAANPQAAPPAPSQGLSGALGTSALGGPPANPEGGSGVFDTLTGNVLRR